MRDKSFLVIYFLVPYLGFSAFSHECLENNVFIVVK